MLWVAAFFAEVIGTMAGFGSSTVFLPIALLFLDFRIALILVAIFHISGNIGRITFFRHGFDKRLLLIFGLPSVVFTLLGALLVKYTPQLILKLILGSFLIAYSLISLLKPGLSFPPNKKNSLLGGSLSGFFAGLIGTGGAIRGAFLTSFNLKKSVYISTAAAISLSVDVTRIPIYFGSGFLETQFYHYIPILFTITIMDSFTGSKILNRIPQPKFRKFVLLAIMFVSTRLLYDSIIYLAQT